VDNKLSYDLIIVMQFVIFEIIYSCGVGLVLGSSIMFIGKIMDITISNKEYIHIIENHFDLYNEAESSIKTNLLLITPVTYSIVTTTILDKTTIHIDPVKTMLLILLHNFGYYVIHRIMHTYPSLYKYHSFHHRFDNILTPSIGNAVSKTEFLTAYVAPMILSSYIVKCNEPTFVLSIGLISLFNLFIHCMELHSVWWLPIFVSPKNHYEHHKERNKHYSASIINYDLIFEKKHKD